MAAKPKVEFIITARDLTRGAFRRIRRSLGDLKSRLVALVGIGVLAKLGTDAARFAKNISDAARALGTTTTELQAIQDVGISLGVDADDVQDALFSLSTARNEAMRGNEDMRESLRRLGVGAEFLQGRRNPLDYMLQLSAAVQGAGGDFSRFQEDLNRIFGEDVTRRLLPVLRQGPADIMGQMVDAVTGGRVASAEAIQTGAQGVIEAQKLLARTNVELLEGTRTLVTAVETLTEKLSEVQEQSSSNEFNATGFSGYSP